MAFKCLIVLSCPPACHPFWVGEIWLNWLLFFVETRPPRTGHKYLELGHFGMTISRGIGEQNYASRSMLDNYYHIFITFIMINFSFSHFSRTTTASTCVLPQRLSGWLSEASFLVTVTVLCGFLVFGDLRAGCLWVSWPKKPRHIDDPLPGICCAPKRFFVTFYINPFGAHKP